MQTVNPKGFFPTLTEKLKIGCVQILFPVQTEEWGQRHFIIKDPGDMVIDVIQEVEPTAEYKEQYTG